MEIFEVIVPRLNANEDQVLLVDLFVSKNDEVAQGDLLFVIESTKASMEVLAPISGRVSSIAVEKGAMIDVGAHICVIATGDSTIEVDSVNPTLIAGNNRRVTAKARLLAAKLGVNIELVPPTGGLVGTKEVEAFAAATSATKTATLRSALIVTSSRMGSAFIIGGGGHAATLIDALQSSGWNIVGCTDPERPTGSHVTGGVTIIGTDDIWDALKTDGVTITFIGVGGTTSNNARRQVFDKALAAGFVLPPLIARSAVFGIDSRVGVASYILPGAVIGPRCIIGTNVLVNSGSIVCHDSAVEDHAHIAPGAVIAGSVTVGTGTTVGMAATVLFQTKIGRNCLIHNGAAVTGDISDDIEFTRDGKRIRRL